MAGMTVRAADPSDLDGILHLYEQLAGERTSARPPGTEVAAPVLARILADSSRHLLVAELDGQVIGTADVTVVSHLMHHAMPWAIVENVVVSEHHRRHGVGRSLFDAVFQLARDAGCCKVELMSATHRHQAHAFYESVGMQRTSEGFKLYLDG